MYKYVKKLSTYHSLLGHESISQSFHVDFIVDKSRSPVLFCHKFHSTNFSILMSLGLCWCKSGQPGPSIIRASVHLVPDLELN